MISKLFNSIVFIYKTHYKLVYHLAYKFLNDTDDAADITQEVFTDLFNQFKKNKEILNIKAWLCKVTCNLCLSFNKKYQQIEKREQLEIIEKDDELEAEIDAIIAEE